MQLSKLLAYIFFFITLAGMSNIANAQVFEPVKWTHEARLVEGGDTYDIIFKAAIDDEWNVYSHFTPEDGPIPTNVFFDDEDAVTKIGDPSELGHKKEGKDPLFDADSVIKYLGDEDYTIIQRVKVSDTSTPIVGYVDYMTCNNERCIKAGYDFNIDLANATLASAVKPIEKKKLLAPVTWDVSLDKKSGDDYTITYTANITEGWTVYSQHTSDDGPVPTEIVYEETDNYTLNGESVETGHKKEGYDKMFDVNVIKFLDDEPFVITQDVKITDITKPVKGYLTYMTCNDKRCLPPTDVDFELYAGKKPVAATANTAIGSGDYFDQKVGSIVSTYEKPLSDCGGGEEEKQGYLWTFIFGFLGGLLALLTPCVFPMIPITVSFFTKDTKRSGLMNGLIYGVSIIAIYVIFGLLITVVFGPEALNRLSTNWIANTAFFVIFIAFALSFFGYYEITLPSSWSTKSDQMADKGGLLGIFFMAATLSLVSFSCTGPIIGSAIVQAATQGSYLGPFIVMFGFSLALALPFGLFAAFPSWLNSLPKSGGWMTSVKVVLGFLELALAFKFLSVADMTNHWDFLKYEVFMGIWIVIFAAMTVYLFGYIRFPHDSKLKKLSPTRGIFAVLSLIWTLYLCTGFMYNDDVKSYNALSIMSGLAPPTHYNMFLDKQQVDPTIKAKYPSFTKCANNIDCFKDYYEGMAYAKEIDKPVMVDFTGHGCVNCRKTEEHIWIKDEIRAILNKDLVLISLYVDDDKKLEKTLLTLDIEGNEKKIRNVGNKWADFQIVNFQQNSQPLYVIMDNNEQVISKPRGYKEGADDYLEYLECSLKAIK